MKRAKPTATRASIIGMIVLALALGCSFALTISAQPTQVCTRPLDDIKKDMHRCKESFAKVARKTLFNETTLPTFHLAGLESRNEDTQLLLERVSDAASTMVLTNSPSVYTCACCAEPGTWFQETAKSDPEVLAIVGQLSRRLDKTAFLYLTAAGVEEVKGISRASETYTLRRLPPYTRDWRLVFTDQQGNRGTLAFTIPDTAVFFGTDLKDGQLGGAGGPLLYKEWRFEGPVSGTGIFKGGTRAKTKFRFILQGRGNMCRAAEDFKSWILQVGGPRADFALSGELVTPPATSIAP